MDLIVREEEVYIDGECIEGKISDKNCSYCGHVIVYHAQYDAYFCPQCNKWLEAVCGDNNCHYCQNRPETPLK